MLDKELISRKMSAIDSYVNELLVYLDTKTVAEILSDEVLLAFIERRFQLIVDTILDINTHLISSLDLTMPDDYQNTFITLGKAKVMPMDFALKIAPVVGLRNRVVHKYEKLDLERFLNDLKDGIVDFRTLLKYVNTYLDSIV